MKKTKIAFFADVMKENLDGVSNTLHQIMHRLPKNQLDILVITPHPPNHPIPGVEIVPCPYLHLPGNKDYRIGIPRWDSSIRRRLDQFEPDLVHWSTPSFLGGYAVKYGRKKRIPISSIYHTHFPAYFPYYLPGWLGRHRMVRIVQHFFKWMFHYTSLILVPTATIADYVRTHLSPKGVKIWARGVDVYRFHPGKRATDFYDKWGVSQEKIVLFVSRLVQEKETNTLIRLAGRISDHSDVRLVVVGDGPDRKRMEKKMPMAVFTGKLEGEELAKTYASADLFVFPSVTETFGNVILEAMASGLPVVAARAGGPTDLVAHGQRGLLVEPKNDELFYTSIIELLNDEEELEKMRKECLAYAQAHNWDELVDELWLDFKQLVGV